MSMYHRITSYHTTSARLCLSCTLMAAINVSVGVVALMVRRRRADWLALDPVGNAYVAGTYSGAVRHESTAITAVFVGKIQRRWLGLIGRENSRSMPANSITWDHVAVL